MIASYSIRSRIDREMKWNTGPQFNTEASYFTFLFQHGKMCSSQWTELELQKNPW